MVKWCFYQIFPFNQEHLKKILIKNYSLFFLFLLVTFLITFFILSLLESISNFLLIEINSGLLEKTLQEFRILDLLILVFVLFFSDFLCLFDEFLLILCLLLISGAFLDFHLSLFWFLLMDLDNLLLRLGISTRNSLISLLFFLGSSDLTFLDGSLEFIIHITDILHSLGEITEELRVLETQ